MDSKISILQYIKGKHISLEHEIYNIRARENVDITILNFISNSPDYVNIQNLINETANNLSITKDENVKKGLETKLNQLNDLKCEFAIDVLRLADILIKLESRSERLKSCQLLFEQGFFRKANEMLQEQDLANDQFNLLVYADYLEYRLENIWNNYNSFVDESQN